MFGLDGEWIDKKFELEYLSLMFNKIFRGDQIISFRVSHNCQNQESKQTREASQTRKNDLCQTKIIINYL